MLSIQPTNVQGTTTIKLSSISPIESAYDCRLVTLIGVVIELIEEMSLISDRDPNELLASNLYLCNKKLLSYGEEEYMNKLTETYPLLEEAIK
jgi:hypothetical protein